MNRLKNIIEPLKELKSVIGMESVKKNIFEQLLYLLQELNDSNMMHTVIEGPPGVGKTLLGKILAKIYYKLNFLKKTEISNENKEINEITSHLMQILNPDFNSKKEKENEKKEEEFKFKIIRRSDLVGQFVGSTAIKTQKVIDESFGGILFIDEVYSLGSGSTNEKGDSFAKEAIDTLNQNLSENGDKFICIIAGYPNEIDKCFFSQNEGLRRRFPFKYTIEKYNPNELAKILESKINEINWKLDKNLTISEIEKFIEKNKKNFENFGGDIENFLLNIKIKHSLRVFGKNPNLKKNINIDDIKNGFDTYVKSKQDKELPQYVKDMYI
jgi:SpoVK/Ycf46/Vps4 family AAA+-type ATPase